MSQPNVYDARRIDPGQAPEGYADDVNDRHFVPAPCQVACPIGTDAPSYLAYIWEGKIEEAFEAITATNPFSSICGRVCDAPCEPACRRTDSDGPVAIRNLKRYVMDKLGKTHRLNPVAVTRRETIAIVGSGPAGLTAAQGLAEAGFVVHVYEMTDKLGGMMTWGIPAFRLPVGIIDEDVDRMLHRCPGITPHLGCALGRDISLDELKARHDAVLLTIGAWWGKGMDIPGGDDPRVVDGVGFLRRVNAGERPIMPETVLVVGGGDVAMDACRVAMRLPGCRNVKVLYRRGPSEIPARKDELYGAIKEGIEIIYNIQPVGVATGNDFGLRCVTTRLGEPDADGRRRPENVAGSEHDVPGGLVIVSVGQKAECEGLARHGMMAGERVKADFDGMRTADPKVFAAGDGAFGGSTIVMAMSHGHRAAYYMKAFLDGKANPLPYRTPFHTRYVPIAQDPDWETNPRHDQAFHGLGHNPVAFPEIESTYDAASAKAEAARCYRCDAETGTADYTVRTREDIFVMARTEPRDARTQRSMMRKRLRGRDDPFGPNYLATLEDLVFLPANLSRLVIDPYRDACNVGCDLPGGVHLNLPAVVTGFDDAPDEVLEGVGGAIKAAGVAYLGRRRPAADVPWLQVVVVGQGVPDAAAAMVVHAQPDGFRPFEPRRARPDQAIGLAVSGEDLEAAIPFALDRKFDLLVLQASGDVSRSWPELAGMPDLSVIRDAVAIMRRMNREEDAALLFFGGARSGTDIAKLIALGANAVVVGAAMGFALGGHTEKAGFKFYGDITSAERAERGALFLKALSSEASIMARCTGKTDVHNLEPEDLRAITLATARAVGVPIAGTHTIPAAAE
ncbi:MAG: glutamate synthase [Alphaproteobacteria bacterium]|nr:glutamate synthase [Alphaproteobacteria bacterium]